MMFKIMAPMMDSKTVKMNLTHTKNMATLGTIQM